MKRLDEITIADLMPDSISSDEQVSATARAIDPQLRLISEAVDRPLILAAIDDLGEGVLEHLAVQYDVTSWDSGWPIETKRTVLKTAIADKRKKGTRGAVERAIEAVAPIATLTEWWQEYTPGIPHTFRIDLLQDGSAVDAETQANVIAQVREAKPVRSHFTFTVTQTAESGFYFAGILRAISYARVRSAGMSLEQTNINAGVLAALRGMNIRRLLASSHMGEMPEPTPPTPVVIMDFGGNFTLNENISSESVDGGFGVLPKALSGRTLNDLTGWSAGGNLNLAFFTPLGALATSDFTMPDDDTGPLYDAEGNPIPYFDSSIQYEAMGAWRIDGSIWTASELAYISSLYEDDTPPTLHWSSDWQPIDNPTIFCMMYKTAEIPTSLDVIVGIKWGGSDWIAPEFPANDWWYTGIRSDEDLVRIQAFGLETTTAAPNAGPWGNIKYSSEYEYEILALYADSNGTTPSQYTDLSNFEMTSHWYSYSATLLVIWYTNAVSPGLITSYKLRITKKTT